MELTTMVHILPYSPFLVNTYLLLLVNEEPARGATVDNVTAYRASQETWGEELDYRPASLFLWQAPSSFSTNTSDIGTLRFNGHPVIDFQDRPIRAFDIPWAISSNIEGYRVEAWTRADPRLNYKDILARLYTKPNGTKRVPLTNSKGLATRRKRFREEVGLVSWGVQHANPEARAFFQSLRSPAQILYNLAVQRDITISERSNYTWITIEKDVDADKVTADLLAKKMMIFRREYRNAIKSYPEDEFKPGAQDESIFKPGARNGGELFRLTYGEQDDKADPGLEKVPEHDVARRSGASSSSRSPHQAAQNRTTGGFGSMAQQDNALTDDGEVQNHIDYLDAESWQNDGPAESAAALYARRQTAGNPNEVPSNASVRSEVEDPTDSRNDKPTSMEEVQMLQSALEQTIADFKELSGGSTPDWTNTMDNYFSQWDALQKQFDTVWMELWNNSNSPALRGPGRWTGGIANWRTAELARSERIRADEEAWAMYFGN